MREKYSVVKELSMVCDQLKGKEKLRMSGLGDFSGADNPTRSAMNTKHKVQHLAIMNPEFPILYDGKENISGKFSSYYKITKKKQIVYAICKKYDRMLKGHSRYALYFLYNPEDDEYSLVQRKEVESLPENYGFEYNNTFLDELEVGEVIKPNTQIVASRSYDQWGNVGVGVNARTLFAIHPAVQDDAIIISESFANRMVANTVATKLIPIGENTILLNMFGKDGEYQGLPNIGDHIENRGIICAARQKKESRALSDIRDQALRNYVEGNDTVYYGKGEVTDITVYSNNRGIQNNLVTKQILEYYNDGLWFWSDVYRTCKGIIEKHPKKVDREIHRYMRLAMNHLDLDSQWAFHDNVFQNIMVSIEIKYREKLSVGRKITGRHGIIVSKGPCKIM